MEIPQPSCYSEIDWKQLRANALSRKGWQSKTSKEWDLKAKSFSGRNRNSEYSDLVLAQLPLEEGQTVLDIGSGPGTLSLPIAQRVSAVTALDFSNGMLNTLNSIAEKENITNIKTVQCAWEDDWNSQGISPHDIAIASRSMGVRDLDSALLKINQYATKFVFICDRIGATPFDAEAFKAINRPFLAGPDYIYTINCLYSLGIFPNITVLKLNPEITFNSFEDALNSYKWMFKDLTTTEEKNLTSYVDGRIVKREGHRLTICRPTPVQWALIWWSKV